MTQLEDTKTLSRLKYKEMLADVSSK